MTASPSARKRRTKEEIRAQFLAAPPAEASPVLGIPEHLRNRWVMRTDGLFKKTRETVDKKDDETGEVKKVEQERENWLCSYFSLEAETLDERGENWGYLLAWRDRNGVERREVFARELFAGDGAELRARLARGGLTIYGAQWARQSLTEYLSIIQTPRRALSVPCIGWHRVEGHRAFVLDDDVFGVPRERIVLQKATRETSKYNQAGTLDTWRESIGKLCIGNTRLIFAVCVAFAAPLIEITGENGGGFHLRGDSRCGKTTALQVAASIWGGETGAGAKGYVRTWRATDNAIEGVALAHNDALMVLDEMAQVDAAKIGDIAYMIANGAGKSRSDRAGGLRVTTTWRTLFLSSGEVGLHDKNAEAGKRTKAGQEMRLIDLRADAGAGLGLFENLHQHDSPDGFADALQAAARRNYGAPARAFLSSLVDRLANDPGYAQMIVNNIEVASAELLSALGPVSGQVVSVARRFGLLAVAGGLACDAGITGWEEYLPRDAVSVMFQSWCHERGTLGQREDEQAVSQLRAFISLNGQNRFERWYDEKLTDGQQVPPIPVAPSESIRVGKRAGWRRWVKDEENDWTWRYFLTVEGMKEALDGLDQNAAHKALIRRGILLPGSNGKSAKSLNAPGHKKARLYEVVSSVLDEFDSFAGE